MAYQEGYLPTEAELQNAIKISLAAADGSLWANSATDEYGQLSQQTEFAQEINTAARTISAYAMNGGDVSKIPQSLQYLASTDWANRIDAAGSGKWRDVLPLLAVAGGGLAGVFGGAAAAGGAAAGTEGAATYGAAGEVAGGAAAGGTGTAGAAAGGATLAEQSAAIGSGSAAGTAAGTGVGTGTAAGTTVTGAGTAGTAASGTALSRILNGTATTEDYLTLTGQVAPSLLGAYASGEQTDALKGLEGQYQAMGAPYRGRLAELYANPEAFLTSPEVTVPVQQGTDIMARSLSTKGNPTGSGNALQQLQSYSADQLFGRLGQEKDRLAGYGGLASYNAAAPAAATNAIASQANVYNAIGGGIADVFTPRRNRSLADILRESGYGN